MTKIHELRDLEHHLEKEAPLRREPETLSEHYAWRSIEEKLASAEERRALCARNAGWRTRRRGASDYRPTVG